MRTVGVEEELLLVDPGSGQPCALSSEVLARLAKSAAGEGGPAKGTFARELQGQQLEFGTRPQTDMEELGAEIVHWRHEAARHAAEAGAAVAALATSPCPSGPP